MSHFDLIGHFDPGPAVAQLARHPELWNQNRRRKDMPNSPHVEMDDIWLRYKETLPTSNDEPFHCVFYPAWRTLTAMQPIVFGLMAKVRATELGGILITRLPPAGRIHPHTDIGAWHAEFHTCKVYAALASNPGCVNWFRDELFIMAPGELWSFDNQVVHSCENNGDSERISLIVSMRVE